ncbi:MAG TPA: T9SS type A sorting domain-containing protein, partial [Bacteroidia bacterium]|nr:T9SS type A sorting domain-containing protein [Bacteroidia bacterium]
NDGRFMVKLENTTAPFLQMEILDGMGRLVFAQVLPGISGMPVPVALSLPDGVYLLRVSGNEAGMVLRRIVIEH